MSADRFDFEQLFMECWAVTSDIEEINNFLCDRAPVSIETHDKVSNMLSGMAELYNLRFDRLFAMFEELIARGQL